MQTTTKRPAAHSKKIREEAHSAPEHKEFEWVGSLAQYAKGKPHSMAKIRERMAERMAMAASTDVGFNVDVELTFDYYAAAKAGKIPAAVLRTLQSEALREFPNDPMLAELHVLRAVKAHGRKRRGAAR
jgi:hypothetical protein